MDQNSALVQDLQASLVYCKKECKILSVSTRHDVLDAIKQSPDYLQWAYNHGLRHAQMQIADVMIKSFTLLVMDLDQQKDLDFQNVIEELVQDKPHRSQLLSAAGYQRLHFIHALRNSMALPLNNAHALDELKETADAMLSVVSKLSEELVNALNMLKTIEA